MGLIELVHLGAGAALAAAGWLIPRHIAGARRIAIAALLLDALPLALGAGLLALATGRPVFAGVIVLALGAGFALADHTMRQTLREPVVFSESGLASFARAAARRRGRRIAPAGTERRAL